MKKILNYKLALVLLTMVLAISCDKDQEVSPVADPNLKPLATITEKTNYDGGVVNEYNEDVIVFDVTLDKMMDESVTFTARQTGGTATEDDYEVVSAVMAPYSTSVEVKIIIKNDAMIEEPETIEFEVGNFGGVANRYVLHPDTEYPKFTATIESQNPEGLVVQFGWEDPAEGHSDFDMLGISEAEGAWSAAATADNPETSTMVENGDADGVYLIGIDPYELIGDAANYTVKVQKPDGSIEQFDGVFDSAKTSTYTKDYFDAWEMDVYRLLKIVKSGSSYTVTHELPQ